MNDATTYAGLDLSTLPITAHEIRRKRGREKVPVIIFSLVLLAAAFLVVDALGSEGVDPKTFEIVIWIFLFVSVIWVTALIRASMGLDDYAPASTEASLRALQDAENHPLLMSYLQRMEQPRNLINKEVRAFRHHVDMVQKGQDEVLLREKLSELMGSEKVASKH